MERTPHNTPKPHYREMTYLGSRMGLLAYAFAPRDVDWKRGVVYGFSALRPHGAWQRGPYPLPNILYDQTKSRVLARSAACRSLKARLAARGTTMLGPGFLTKNQVWAILRQVPDLQSHLPETTAATPSNVRSLLRRYPSVYVKHAGGTLGWGVVRVSRAPAGSYRWEAAKGFRRTARLHLSGADSLTRRLRLTTRRGPWLAQQGLDLCRFGGRPADIRMLVQKDGRGEWQLTVGFAKVAAPGQVVTNIGAGGSLRRLDDLLRSAARHHGWEETPAELKQRLMDVAFQVARALDRSIGPLAELGLDLALDAKAHVWLIEANGKYSRAVFSNSVRLLSIQRVFAYSRHLYELRPSRKSAKASPPAGLPREEAASKDEGGGDLLVASRL